MHYLYSNQISVLLPVTTRLDDEPSPESKSSSGPFLNVSLELIMPKPADILRDTLDRFTILVPPLCTQIIVILITRCSEPLQLVRSIPSQYRAMSSRNIDLPTEPSYFVPNILRPLREFLLDVDGEGFPLKKDFGSVFAQEVFKALVLKYTSYLAGMKKTEDSIRRYKKGKRSTFMLFGSSSNASGQNDQEGRDEARIRMQMVLDVEMLGKDASAMEGLINVQKSKEFRELVSLAAQNESTAVSALLSSFFRCANGWLVMYP
jgi:conserved oligomeric Golgi complex subunit 2